jgi:uncharacterized protein YneF (UPF0154 family)
MANPTETNRGSKFIDILDNNPPLNELSLRLRFMQSFKNDRHVHKGNNKITELRTILQRESQNP